MNIKILIISCLLLFAFTTSDNKSEYTIPLAAYSVFAEDLDLDGDKDIIVGHNYDSQTEWSGISILENQGNGNFILTDSIYLFGWQPDVQIRNLDSNLKPEIIAKYENPQEENEYIAVVNNFDENNISYFSLNTYEGIEYLTSGDIDNKNGIDIVFASNNAQFWGILYNNGQGGFLEPEYIETDVASNDIACGNLNEDNREDVVVSGARVDIYFSYEDSLELYSINKGEIDIEIADFDLDGDNDILGLTDLYMIGYAQFTFYENLGNNSFTKHESFNFQPPGSKFIVADMNNDSLVDIVFLSHYSKNVMKNNKEGSIYIFYNQGNFQLGDSMYVPIESISNEVTNDVFCSDLDGNGYNDIIIIRLLHAPIPNLKILFNDGDGHFVENPQTKIIDPDLGHNKNTLMKCYPNPFSLETRIEYKLLETTEVNLQVYDINGRLIRCLINGKKKKGSYSIKWNGLNLNNRICKSGIYIAHIKLNNTNQSYIKLIKN